MFRVIITGPDYFEDEEFVFKTCDNLLKDVEDRIAVVCGCMDGVDLIGEKYAHLRGYHVHYYPLNRRLYGAAAGKVRNREMVENADALIAFSDQRDKCTLDLIKQAKEKELKVRVVKI